MSLDELRNDEANDEENYDLTTPFLKALARTIVHYSQSTHASTPELYSPHQFLRTLTDLHHREISVSEHSSARLKNHREVAVGIRFFGHSD